MSTGLGLPVWHGGRCCRSTWRQIVLQYSPKFYGGFFLTDPKAGSAGTVDLDPVVAVVLAEHRRTFPPVAVDLVDIRSGEPVPRSASLLFTTTHGNPFTDRTWSREWARWGDAAGWPKEHGGFHALRHFFATTLITNHAEATGGSAAAPGIRRFGSRSRPMCTGGPSASGAGASWGRCFGPQPGSRS